MKTLARNRKLKAAAVAALVLGGCGSPPPPPPATPAAEGAGKTVNMKAAADQREAPHAADQGTTEQQPAGQ